jgi:heterodisulfide reductase subunit A-like polyferredoxin
MSKPMTLTLSIPHLFVVGDQIRFSDTPFIQLLTRPRITVVTGIVDDFTVEIENRRMTWAEWRAGIVAHIKGWF